MSNAWYGDGTVQPRSRTGGDVAAGLASLPPRTASPSTGTASSHVTKPRAVAGAETTAAAVGVVGDASAERRAGFGSGGVVGTVVSRARGGGGGGGRGLRTGVAARASTEDISTSSAGSWIVFTVEYGGKGKKGGRGALCVLQFVSFASGFGGASALGNEDTFAGAAYAQNIVHKIG